MKYFPHQSGANSEQAVAMNATLVTKLEMDSKPATMITTKNRASEFFIEKAKLKNLNPITCMGSLGLNSSKSIQFFNGDHKHVDFLRLLHAITMIGYGVKISLTPSDFPFGTIKVDPCCSNEIGQVKNTWPISFDQSFFQFLFILTTSLLS